MSRILSPTLAPPRIVTKGRAGEERTLSKYSISRAMRKPAARRSNRSATATIDYDTDGGDTSYEVTVNRDLDDGKSVEVTFDPESKDLDIEYVDTEFESGATWTANVAVPLEASNIADAATLKLKRSWTW